MPATRHGLSRALRFRGSLGLASILPLAAGTILLSSPVRAQEQAPEATPATTPEGSPPEDYLAPPAKPEPKVLISEVVVKGIEGHP